MEYNILIGGAAGQGIDTMAAVLEKLLKRKGYKIFTIRDYMSRVRGGHNFMQIRFGSDKIYSHCDELDGILSLNDETLELHTGRLKPDGFAIGDEESMYQDTRLLKLPLKKSARELGNIKAAGSIAIGAALGILGILPDEMETLFNKYFSSNAALINLSAVLKGMQMVEKRRLNVFQDADNNLLINGNEAVALGALAAGCKFYSAYPMTPSTSIMNYLASKMLDAEIVVEQAEDEIAAINMAIGASFAGARAMTGTSGGGFCLMVEALGLSGLMELPLVVIDVQRPGPVTGLPTRTEQSDLKFVISASHGEFPRLVIALRNPEDAFKQTVRAFSLADRYRLPVILLSDQFLSDTTVTTEPFNFDVIRCYPDESSLTKIEPAQEGNSICQFKTYKMTDSGISPGLVPGRQEGVTVVADSDEHDEYGHITESAEVRIQQMDKRLGKLKLLKEELQEPDYFGEEDCDVLLVAWGSVWGPVREAVRVLNEEKRQKYGALVFGDIWPLPVKLLEDKAHKASRMINVEQNATGQLASLISEVTGLFCDQSILKYDGRAMNAQFIYSGVKEGE